VMAFVRPLAAAVAGQLDAVAFDPIDFAKGRSFGVDDLHMLADLVEVAHSDLLLVVDSNSRGAPYAPLCVA
jgi:hypothetical protein